MALIFNSIGAIGFIKIIIFSDRPITDKAS